MLDPEKKHCDPRLAEYGRLHALRRVALRIPAAAILLSRR